MRALELLAPARNLECGIAAIDHGADAVYIGAPRFGARAAAANSVHDIAKLCSYAHLFQAKVYVTVNTILYDNELNDTRRLLLELQQAGVDAILVQDMALVSSVPPSLPLHASTQTDNRTPQKVAWLYSLGFSRVVLARELSVNEIRAIHEAVPDAELEVFVHGALCVSYSGQCYASQYCFRRSANRGQCAQFCRMKFNLVDADGQIVENNRYLLSLKDLCLYDHLQELAQAGATSFKIEGRLKDINYVKNVTAAYSQRLDELVAAHPESYCRASRGRVCLSFTPDLHKTFNRGYTTYFLHGRQPSIASFDTPKAMGQYVGLVKDIHGQSFTVAGTARFANGDGLCFVNKDRQLEGFRVNRAASNRIFPLQMPRSLRPGTRLYRNNDQEFERLLAKQSAERRIPVTMTLTATTDGFRLAATASGLPSPAFDAAVELPIPHQTAEKSQRENVVRQLTKLGATPFVCDRVDMADDFNFFIPSSYLSELRRALVERLLMCSELQRSKGHRLYPQPNIAQHSRPPQPPQPHLQNIANSTAAAFYGTEAPTAYELHPAPDAVLMQCRYCLRHELGYCQRHGGRRPSWREPLFLRLDDGRQFRLLFDCQHCQMNIYASIT